MRASKPLLLRGRQGSNQVGVCEDKCVKGVTLAIVSIPLA